MILTDREKKLVLVKYIIHGVSPFDAAPLDKRVKMLKVAVEKAGLNYDESELMKLGELCIDLQGKLNHTLTDYLEDNPELVAQAHKEIHKGNDSLVGQVGDDIAAEGESLMKNPKWYAKFKP